MDKHTVIDDNGSINIPASVTAYADALSAWAKNNSIPTEKVERATESVFDRFEGKPIKTNVLIDLAAGEIMTSPEQHPTVTKRLKAYIKSQKDIGRFTTKLGIGGGVSREYKIGDKPKNN